MEKDWSRTDNSATCPRTSASPEDSAPPLSWSDDSREEILASIELSWAQSSRLLHLHGSKNRLLSIKAVVQLLERLKDLSRLRPHALGSDEDSEDLRERNHSVTAVLIPEE